MVQLRYGETTSFTKSCRLFNKLTSVFYASDLLLMINCVITLSGIPMVKVAVEITRHWQVISTANFDDVMTTVIIYKRTDAYKTDVGLFVTRTKPPKG